LVATTKVGLRFKVRSSNTDVPARLWHVLGKHGKRKTRELPAKCVRAVHDSRELANRELPRNYQPSCLYGRGAGVGRGLGVGVTLGVIVGLAEGVAVAVAVAVAVGVGVTVTVAVAVGVGVGVPCAQLKISIELNGVIPSLA
jgi:hypothetical protein